MHLNIDKRNKVYQTVDDVLRVSKILDEGVYRFCAFKANYDQERGELPAKTIQCCRNIINTFKRCDNKYFYSEACKSVLNQPPQKWNSYCVDDMYKQIVEEYLNTQKNPDTKRNI